MGEIKTKTEEFVKGLRERAERFDCDGWVDTAIWFEQAADVIEELEKKMLDWQAVADEHWEAYQHWFHNYMNDIPKWISVTERLPEDGVYVLARYKNNDMVVACVFEHDECLDFWRAMTDEGWCADCDTEPTHWMPLPEPPKEETE